MSNLTLQQLFGVNATQTSTTITIVKTDLSGLTISANNSAESLLAAIFVNAWQEFEGIIVDELDNTLVDELGVSIGYEYLDIYAKLKIWFWKRQYINSRIRDTLIINVFITPPFDYGEVLNLESL